MPFPVSVIIPTLNEEDWIAAAVQSAFGAGAAEVIVADALARHTHAGASREEAQADEPEDSLTGS